MPSRRISREGGIGVQGFGDLLPSTLIVLRLLKQSDSLVFFRFRRCSLARFGDRIIWLIEERDRVACAAPTQNLLGQTRGNAILEPAISVERLLVSADEDDPPCGGDLEHCLPQHCVAVAVLSLSIERLATLKRPLDEPFVADLR